ncbi:hypothetical protein J4E83_006950 [Alternaria metachromatica]|uniref:uncharacterized protein n=1 Tax=Alternaria metachromatica TaxID=283354 RepID=UPI0020C3EB9A|nr:uncharacterized protein J4E83_006950 [Alternaria metachromatica]KAI4615224.1 hypothetical protein J4E83_006950 [Alternaria metachromatica]
MSNDPKTSDAGRETPLPQYEKTQSVPFTLNLQEDARNPGQFQLVFNLGPKQQPSIGMPLSCAPNVAASTTLRDGFKSSVESSVPQKTSPPSTPLHDRQGWADLDNVPPDFLKKVVPDWNVSFSRSDSTASTQSKRLTDIKARIKKKGKGYVVRLLKGSTDSNEIAEVDLGQAIGSERVFATPELDSAALPAELYSPPSAVASSTDSLLGRDDIFEIGTSNTSGIERSLPSAIRPRNHLSHHSLARTSIAEDGFSDVETLIPDIRSIHDRIDEDQTEVEPSSQAPSLFPTRSASVSSIIKTPTRGLSLVGPVRKRVEKRTRPRVKSRGSTLDLKRSDAHKSVKRRVGATAFAPDNQVVEDLVNSTTLRQRIRPVSRKLTEINLLAEEYATWSQSMRDTSAAKPRHVRHASADDLHIPSRPKHGLRLNTDVSQTKSAHVSPATRRKRSPRIRKNASSSSSSIDTEDANALLSPQSAGASRADELREALRRALDQVESGNEDLDDRFEKPVVPTIVESFIDDHVGEIPLPPEAEIRMASPEGRNTTLRYWGLALSAFSDKAHEGFRLLRDTFGTEPPVPQGHVRVRWTCYSPSRTVASNPFSVRMPSFVQESWLLTCANEGRLTPKIVHLDVNEGRVRSDKDLALALREHYDQLNRRWFNWARLRGLTTIEFVQFEVHRNRFADIRATPSMPPKSAASSASTSEPEKSAAPSQHPYTFEPNDLLPPVGSTYLLHLFKHPQDYEGELITYLRSPKRRQRLEFGMGWGVHLVEGFLAQRVWAVTMGVCGLGSAVFAILWTVRKGDVQGAFGVAQWVLGIAVLLVGGLQAWLE